MNLDLTQEQRFPISSPKTYIAFVLDKSGSMSAIRDVAVRGFNDQLDSITREASPNTFVSLVTFSTFVTPIFFNRKVGQVEKLSFLNYKPEGWTALYDAVGYTISRLENESEYDFNTAFLVVIISDGYENRSTDYTSSSLANLIKRKQSSGRWTFAYVGANQDLSKVSELLHIPVGNTIRYDSNPIGTAAAFVNVSNSTSGYLRSRSLGVTATTSFSAPDSSGDSHSTTILKDESVTNKLVD